MTSLSIIDRISVQYAVFYVCISDGIQTDTPPAKMGLNFTVERGNREQDAQETHSSSQQPERKTKHHINTDKIYPLEAFGFLRFKSDRFSISTVAVASRGTRRLDAVASWPFVNILDLCACVLSMNSLLSLSRSHDLPEKSFFSGFFYLGKGYFKSIEPDSYLFGDKADLRHLTHKPTVVSTLHCVMSPVHTTQQVT